MKNKYCKFLSELFYRHYAITLRVLAVALIDFLTSKYQPTLETPCFYKDK
jgi:hypothetical protein